MSKLNMFIPLTKVDEEKRLVYGRATQEVMDKSGEIIDYDSSKPLFEAWSNGFADATAGKSYGNIREQHDSSKAVGKVANPICFDDAGKSIDICVKVVDDSTWEKVKENVLTGFSVGGSYAKRWTDSSGNRRYTANPAEISLVDNPCVPTAVIDFIKADGSIEKRKIQHKEDGTLAEEVNKDILADFRKALASKELAKAFSYEEITNRINGALHAQIKTPFDCGYFWIKATYPDSVIICGDIDGDRDEDMYRVYYTMDDKGIIALGDIEQVRMEFVPATDEDDDNTMNGLPKTGDNEAEKTVITDAPAVEPETVAKAETPAAEPTVEELVEKAISKANELAKSGKKHSKETMAALTKMHHELTQLGAACKCDKCVKMCGGTEPAAKAAEPADLHKTDEPEEPMQKVDTSDELEKAVKGLADLQKAFDGFKSENEALQKRVKELENQPMPGGAIVQNGTAAVNKTVGSDPAPQPALSPLDEEIARYESIAKASRIPMEIHDAEQKLAELKMKKTLAAQ